MRSGEITFLNCDLTPFFAPFIHYYFNSALRNKYDGERLKMLKLLATLYEYTDLPAVNLAYR